MALISPLLPRSITFHVRQTGPAQCQSLCSSVSSIPTTNCPTTTCCTTSYESNLFQCLACIGTAGNLTDFTPAQQQIDGLVSACASDGITLPSLTFSSAGVVVQTLQSASQSTTSAGGTASNPLASDSSAAPVPSTTASTSVPITTTIPPGPTTTSLSPQTVTSVVPSPTSPPAGNNAMKRDGCQKVYITLVALSLFSLLI